MTASVRFLRRMPRPASRFIGLVIAASIAAVATELNAAEPALVASPLIAQQVVEDAARPVVTRRGV